MANVSFEEFRQMMQGGSASSPSPSGTPTIDEFKQMMRGEAKGPLKPTLKNIAGAGFEPNLSLLTGTVAQPIAGLAGLGTMAGNVLGLTDRDPSSVIRNVSGKLTYAPKSESGQRAMEAISYPFQKLGEYAGKAGETVLEKTGSPLAGSATDVLIQSLPMLAGSKLGPNLQGGVRKLESAAQATKRFGSGMADLVRNGGEQRLVQQGIRDLVGKEQLPAVRQSLKEAPVNLPPRAPAHGAQGPTAPGSLPTAAEAVAGTPGGSPIQAYQNIIARTPGGVSARFAEQKGAQEAARAIAESIRNAETAPMRETALAMANRQGGVKTPKLLADIYDLSRQPGMRSSEVVTKTLDAIRNKIIALQGKNLRIDAKDLYTIRKEIGNTIQTYAKETANWDKNLTAGLERSIQKSMDTAIEQSGGIGWKQYLQKYADATKKIERDIERSDLARKPVQRTSVGGGIESSEHVRHLLPNILARPITGTKWVAETLANRIQPKMDAYAAELLLNPKQLAEALYHPAPMPSRYPQLDAGLRQSLNPLAALALTQALLQQQGHK